MEILGIDIGGTKIKGAMVDSKTGTIISEVFRIDTPTKSKPKNIAHELRRVIENFKNYSGTIGVGFPATIIHGKIQSINNLNSKWIGKNLREYFQSNLNFDFQVINDADAAGIAEINFSNPLNKNGKTLFITLGSGIGSALFMNGHLIPNTEFGLLPWENSIADKVVSNRARVNENLSWQSYGTRLGKFLKYLQSFIQADRIILGGGVSNEILHFKKYLPQEIDISAAFQKNGNGIIGAALSVKLMDIIPIGSSSKDTLCSNFQN